ncbi:bifunctional proline dehydrogenase/L-glutamate gamma-semialdehyde dehydrogenase PutA [Zymobacter palmae]|uniref:Bifunctional protein PutA n=1 Tax=Zymobacter palmae TaxID=33074 RepID=A0A348HDU9_9GAMM|nr:bifunctional proline dehydrogenase/L-glutamate gamma-semialdehyde dehydrogenase PutA [Zymobacter palmae]BBG29801.1 delta1-pyrroline-5-carboxylate dehydrogenase [Zymobacter palmae]
MTISALPPADPVPLRSPLDAAQWQEPLDTLMTRLSQDYLTDEAKLIQRFIAMLALDEAHRDRVDAGTVTLVRQVRERAGRGRMVDTLLQQYSLSTHEGLQLMCLAEALLRVPDRYTIDALIKDKLSVADWRAHLGQSPAWWVNASTWSLLLTGRVLTLDDPTDGHPSNTLKTLVNRLGEPVIRKAMMATMKLMGHQFVLGQTMKEALNRSRQQFRQGNTYSYDMLGEAALTQADADRYAQAYADAIQAVGTTEIPPETPMPSVSIKLSALHPRYSVGQQQRVMSELVPTVIDLVRLGRSQNVAITIDAEEAARLELSLAVFEAVYASPEARGWGGLGLVVQAYSRRALPTLYWLTRLSDQQGDLIPVRLVKGAYWDAEIKLAQQLGLEDYPVFTLKSNTDVSYLACARYLLSGNTEGRLFPQFATHNAHTLISLLDMANGRAFECQRLHGMGEALYETLLESAPKGLYCRIYAPVGAHRDLLPYLVRRLLENGANSSFVHQLLDERVPPERLSRHPISLLDERDTLVSHRIVPPRAIFGPSRSTAKGFDMNIHAQYSSFAEALAPFLDEKKQWQAGPLVAHDPLLPSEASSASTHQVTSPYDHRKVVGQVLWTDTATATAAVDTAELAFKAWYMRPIEERAALLDRCGETLETHMPELAALCIREAGKQLNDAIADVREAIDFCHYYADQARQQFGKPMELPGTTGETNTLAAEGRGIFVAISPWNFPVAIFTGQVMAALVAGNTVLAKPAEQTSLCAYRIAQLMHEVGVPLEVLQLLPGDGAELGKHLLSDPRISGVVFTGSNPASVAINRTLAARDDAPLPVLIAETGGLNAMLVDATALPEQVIRDVVESAFQSAGQRCSALRILYVQEDIADGVMEALKGAMDELKIGDPAQRSTDVGPVIDEEAREGLQEYIDKCRAEGCILHETQVPDEWATNGSFVAPTAIRLSGIEALDGEHFGPILHVATYKAADADKVIDAINARRYGLTFGLHSRNQQFTDHVMQRVRVGNVYINRNIIGAVVGSQPFGGQGLSGTGPKAGGPHYLQRFVTEKTRTINTTAQGGNASLMAMGD